MNQSYDIAVIGGGASGFAAAITAARLCNGRIAIFEKENRVLKKLLKTGNGRCNLTNTDLSADYYHSADLKKAEEILKHFSLSDTLRFFEEIGLYTTETDGRIYPAGEQASVVVDLLRTHAAELGVIEICDFPVVSLAKQGDYFVLASPDRTVTADIVIVAAGSKAAVENQNMGYSLLEGVGHKIKPVFPALTPVKTDNTYTKQLKGIRVKADVRIGNQTQRGEVLFTEYGLSGIAVMNFSIYARPGDIIALDVAPEHTKQELAQILIQLAKIHPTRKAQDFLSGLLPKKLGHVLLKIAGCGNLEQPIGSISKETLKQLAGLIKGFTFDIKGTKGFDSAQVCGGGAALDEIDTQTMESKIVPGLHITGEILDAVGICGGYNLQWAWSTGCLAGQAAGEKSKKKNPTPQNRGKASGG